MRASDRREQILQATSEMVADRGFHDISIEAIARAAGVSRPIVYDHFGDLAGLLEALLDRVANRAAQQLAPVLPSARQAGNRREQFLAALRGYLEAARSDPVTWRLVLMPPEGVPEILRQRVAIGRNAVLSQLAAATAPGLASPDPQLTARILSVIADEAVRLMLTDPHEYPIARFLAEGSWLLERLDAPPAQSAY
jgi:AcrR family transcriptional regulator